MDKINFYFRIQKLENEAANVASSLYSLRSTDITKDPSTFQALTMNIALRSERLTCKLRNLVFSSAAASKTEYMEQVQEMHDINIAYKDEILKIELPGLVPKRILHSNTSFLNDPLHYAFQAYLEKSSLPLFNRCVVCFTQVYDQSLDLARVRDYDNLQFKHLLDTIGTFVLEDDNGIHCDTHYTTQLGKQDQTLIHIMEHHHFPDWFKALTKSRI